MNLIKNIQKKIYQIKLNISNKIDEDNKKIYKNVFSISACFVIVCLCIYIIGNSTFSAYSVDADGALTKYKSIFNTIYGWLIASAAGIGCSLAAYNFLIIMTSKNQRKIEESFAWIKAIFIAFVFLGIVSLIVGAISADFDTIVNGASNHPLFDY